MLFRNTDVIHKRQKQAVEMFYIKGAKETWQYNINSRPNPVLEGRNAIKKILDCWTTLEYEQQVKVFYHCKLMKLITVL